jgi:thiamine pyrophosphate-dependent acetolactate synthase large subunit-like protein
MSAQGMSKEDIQMLAGFEKTSIAAIAKSFGANGIRVTRPEDLESALSTALNSNTLTVVEVITQIDNAAPKAWAPKEEHNATY